MKFVQPHAYADAVFAGCPRTLRSTSGAQIQIEGPNTRFPSFAKSIRQQAAANSTPDAELAAINMAFRVTIVPALDLWKVLSPCSVICFVHEDNSACISVICSGKTPTMRSISRSQDINIQILHEFLGVDNPDRPCYLIETDSKDRVADIHTKGFIDPADWIYVCQNANMFYLSDSANVIEAHDEYFKRQLEVEKSNKLPRPPHVHDLKEYLLGSSSQQVSSNSPVNDAVACAAICPRWVNSTLNRITKASTLDICGSKIDGCVTPGSSKGLMITKMARQNGEWSGRPTMMQDSPIQGSQTGKRTTARETQGRRAGESLPHHRRDLRHRRCSHNEQSGKAAKARAWQKEQHHHRAQRKSILQRYLAKAPMLERCQVPREIGFLDQHHRLHGFNHKRLHHRALRQDQCHSSRYAVGFSHYD